MLYQPDPTPNPLDLARLSVLVSVKRNIMVMVDTTFAETLPSTNTDDLIGSLIRHVTVRHRLDVAIALEPQTEDQVRTLPNVATAPFETLESTTIVSRGRRLEMCEALQDEVIIGQKACETQGTRAIRAITGRGILYANPCVNLSGNTLASTLVRPLVKLHENHLASPSASRIVNPPVSLFVSPLVKLFVSLIVNLLVSLFARLPAIELMLEALHIRHLLLWMAGVGCTLVPS